MLRPLQAATAVALMAFTAACRPHRAAPDVDPIPREAGAAITQGIPCGALECAQFPTAEEALARVVSGDPLVLALGEAHAPRGAKVPSAARRFGRDLLPLLAGRASDLLVELMMPPSGCARAVGEARASEAAVTAKQSTENPDDYLALGEAARSLGIVPDTLRPDCGDLDALRGDAADPVSATLETIARLTLVQAERLVARDARSDGDRGKMVVIYGGLLHNDLAPRPEAAAWSYAPALDAFARGRFVSLDLVVPEFVGDDATWRSLPWYAAYDAATMSDRPTLFRVGPRSFVLVFARAAP